MTRLIDQSDRPTLATAGHIDPPDSGPGRVGQRAIIEGILRGQWSTMGVVDTGKKAADLGKKAADALTDKAKQIEDKATQQEKQARDEKHRKDNGDKARKDGASASEMWHHDAAHAFADGLDAPR